MERYKTNNQRETIISRYSQSSCFCENTLGILVILVIVCAATPRTFATKNLVRQDEKPQEIKQSLNQTERQVLLPVSKPLRTEQEVVELKNREVKLAEELLREFPDSDNSLMIMGNLYYRHGNAVEALGFWKKSLKINPKQANIYASMGWLYLKKGEFEDAIVQYRKALEIQPNLPEVHSNMGHAFMMSGRPDEAIKELNKELQISPNSSFAYFLLGQAYLQQKEYEKAKKNYETAIKIKPDYTNAYYGLSTACAKLGINDKAREYSANFKRLKTEARRYLKGRKVEYDDFAETQKNAAITYINIGQMYRGNGKLQKAEQLLKQAAGFDPNNVVCFLELSSLYQANRQHLKALQMQRRVSEIQPKSHMSQLIIGILSAYLKKMDEAEDAFRKVITLAPKSSVGYRELARFYLKTKKELPQAKVLAEKAVALEASAANYFVLSWACYENGDINNAFPAIKRAIVLDPKNSNYRLLYKLIQQKDSRYGPYR
jgi:tetratricopeptide (TPR) repeat protein